MRWREINDEAVEEDVVSLVGAAVEEVVVMRMQGWSDAMWKPMPAGWYDCTEKLELVANMAGNAYSLWHYGPISMATWATVGRYYKQFAAHGKVAVPNEEVPVNDSSDSSSSSG